MHPGDWPVYTHPGYVFGLFRSSLLRCCGFHEVLEICIRSIPLHRCKNDFSGLYIAVFGNSINIFKKRITFAGESILKQYYDSLKIYESEYIFERIDGGFRKKTELIPFEAYREAVANAIVHRAWDIKANTKI